MPLTGNVSQYVVSSSYMYTHLYTQEYDCTWYLVVFFVIHSTNKYILYLSPVRAVVGDYQPDSLTVLQLRLR